MLGSRPYRGLIGDLSQGCCTTYVRPVSLIWRLVWSTPYVDLDMCDHLIRLDSECYLVLILVSIYGPQTPTLRVVTVGWVIR